MVQFYPFIFFLRRIGTCSSLLYYFSPNYAEDVASLLEKCSPFNFGKRGILLVFILYNKKGKKYPTCS